MSLLDRTPSTRRGPDLLVLAVGAVALVTYALHGVHGILTRDLGLYSYAGQEVARGVPPYVGVLNRAGPLAHLLPAVGVGIARLGGFDDLITMRIVFMLIATVCTCMVYLLGRDLFRSRLAGLLTAGAFLTFSGFIRYAADGPREKTPMTLFIVCALWAVVHRRWFTAGVFVSLATLCLQTAFFSTFIAVAVGALLLARGHRLRALLRVFLGGAVPVAVYVAYAAVVGSLQESVDGFLLLNLSYNVADPLFGHLGPSVDNTVSAYGLSMWVLLFGLLALLGLAVSFIRPRWRWADPSVPVLVSFAVATAAGLLWDLRDYDAWPDLFPVLPFAAVGVAAFFMRVTVTVPRRVVAVAATVALVAAGATAVYESVSTRDERLDIQRAEVENFFAQLPEDATVTSVEAPEPLVLTRRTNPTRHQMFSGGLYQYVDDTWPGGIVGFRHQLVARKPTLIALGDTMSDYWRQSFSPQYTYVGEAPGWLWYARTSLGEAKLAALRRAAAEIDS